MNIAARFSVPPRKFLGFCERVADYASPVDDGGEVFGFTSGDFSLIDVISALVAKMDSPALVVSTWTAAGAEMTHVEEFLSQNRISSSRWILDRSFQNRQPDLCQSLRDRFGDEALRVQRVHCKFALLEDANRKITLQTSANLNRNLRIENVSVSACPVFFEAYSQLVSDIFDTQMPGDGFEASHHVTASFRQVTQKKSKRKTIANPFNHPRDA